MKNVIYLLITLVLSSCGNSQINTKTFIDKISPTEIGIKQELLDNLISDIKNGKIKNIHGLLIIKDDKLIIEEYFKDFNRNELHYTASVSKSFASVLLGIAIDKGFIKGGIQGVLNKNVSELFPDYANIIRKDNLKNNLKLKHILSMTAGFDWDEHTHPYSDSRNDCNRINNSSDPMKFLFERKLISTPGSEFYYNGGLSLSISYLIERNTGMSVDKFAEKYLFKTLNIKDYRWDEVENGLIDTDGGLHLKAIDQAKLGYLYLNNGKWKNQQIISKEWITETTKVHVTNLAMPDYGYHWWCGDFFAMDKTFFTYFASGHGGQKIFVFPGFNMVIVVTQQVFDNPFDEINNIAILSSYILPAILNKSHSKDEFIKIKPDNLLKYVGRYESKSNNDFTIIELVDNKLIGTSSDGSKYKLYPASENIFKTTVLDLIDIQIKFIPDEEGNIKQMTSSFGFRNVKFVKTVTE